MRTSSTRSPRAKRASLYGPVPTAALPVLKSSVLAPAAAFFDTMKTEFMSYGTIAYGVAVFSRIVWRSTISFATIGRVKVVNGPGLVVSVAGRSIENATSSAVSSVPSWNFTPLRSLNSQVVGSTGAPRLGEAGDEARVLVDVRERLEDVPGDVVVRRDVDEVRVDRRDVGGHADAEIGGARRRARRERGEESESKAHGGARMLPAPRHRRASGRRFTARDVRRRTAPVYSCGLNRNASVYSSVRGV